MSELTIPKALFDPGMVVATPGATKALKRNKTGSFSLLSRHITGDWGSLGPEGVEDQRMSLTPEHHDDQVASIYDLDDGTKVWVITEWDRSVTTFLLPEEY